MKSNLKSQPPRIHWSKHWVEAARKSERKLPPGSELRKELQELVVRAKMKDNARELGKYFDLVLAHKEPELESAIARAMKPRPNPFR